MSSPTPPGDRSADRFPIKPADARAPPVSPAAVARQALLGCLDGQLGGVELEYGSGAGVEPAPALLPDRMERVLADQLKVSVQLGDLLADGLLGAHRGIADPVVADEGTQQFEAVTDAADREQPGDQPFE